MKKCQEGHLSDNWKVQGDLLYYKGKLFITSNSVLILIIIKEMHTTAYVDFDKTIYRIKQMFLWKVMSKHVRDFFRLCDICQRNKRDSLSTKGLLSPLLIQQLVWEDISMDFVEGLLKSEGKSVIFVLVDRLSKFDNFIPTSHRYIAV